MRCITEIPEACPVALVLALTEKDGDTLQLLKWQPKGEPRCSTQLQLLFFGILSVFDELETEGRSGLVERLQHLIQTRSPRELVEIFAQEL
jgi:hypothetical protein